MDVHGGSFIALPIIWLPGGLLTLSTVQQSTYMTDLNVLHHGSGAGWGLLQLSALELLVELGLYYQSPVAGLFLSTLENLIVS